MRSLVLFVVCALFSLTLVEEVRPWQCDYGCRNWCSYGYIFDDRGCPTCRCQPSPCGRGRDPLLGFSCGRQDDQMKCPPTHYCKYVSSDISGICCPRRGVPNGYYPKQRQGTCPEESPSQIGICIAKCVADSDCGNNQKCCGNCPRQCVDVEFSTW